MGQEQMKLSKDVYIDKPLKERHMSLDNNLNQAPKTKIPENI